MIRLKRHSVFGHEGFQSVLGGIPGNTVYLQRVRPENPEMMRINPADYGLVTLLRIYPKGTDARKQYKNELSNASFRKDLLDHNALTHQIPSKYPWVCVVPARASASTDSARHCLKASTPVSATEYNRDLKDNDAVVYAIKMFPMNVHHARVVGVCSRCVVMR